MKFMSNGPNVFVQNIPQNPFCSLQDEKQNTQLPLK